MTPFVGDILESTAGKLVKGLVDKFLPRSASEVEKLEFGVKAKNFVITELKINQETIDSVNKTMQAEAKSEHWMQWAWRPTVGFTFAGTIINNYILLPYLKGFGLAPIVIPTSIWQAMLIVLGVSAGTRGLEKWEKSKKKKKES